MSRGTKAVLAIAVQAALGTIPASGWSVLPRTSDSLNSTFTLTDSEIINDSRIRTAGMVTSANAEGGFETEFIKGVYDDLFSAVAGNEWVIGAEAENDVLTFGGDVVKMFAIEKHNKDIGQYHLWTGLRANSFTLTVPEEGLITLAFGFMGSGYENKLTKFSTNPTATPTTPKATNLSITDIRIDTVTTKGVSCATAFSFEVANNIERQNCLGQGLYGAGFLEYLADMTGSITLSYSRKTQEYLNKQATGAPLEIEVDIKFPDESIYTLRIPKAQISGDIPSGGKDKLEAQLTYTVYADTPADAPTLSRKLVA